MSQPTKSEQPPLPPQPEAELTWEHVRQALDRMAKARGCWAGLPLVHDNIPLVIEPRYPFAYLNGKCLEKDAAAEQQGHERTLARLLAKNDDPDAIIHVRNYWSRGDETIWVLQHDSRVYCVCMPQHNQLELLLRTMVASDCLSVEAEQRALATLRERITPTQYDRYLLTGTFVERSQRSGVLYLFRKCRPTLALRQSAADASPRVLASLCLHPIGYYEYSWTGVMVPTDDVLAHLYWMRGDERRFWAKANQSTNWS